MAIDACLLALMLVTVGCTFEDHSRPSAPGLCRNRWSVPVSGTGGRSEGATTELSCSPGSGGPPQTDAGGLDVAQWNEACALPVDASATPSIPIGRWNFDESVAPLVGLNDLTLEGQPGSDGQIPDVSSNTRVNGKGKSLRLNGHQYFVLNDAESLASLPASGITVSAWISLSLDDLVGHGPVVWPIVSTLSDGNSNCGYQLDIRFEGDGMGPKLAFAYGSADAEGNCKVTELKRVLDTPSGFWGPGRWQHVTGAFLHTDTGDVPAIFVGGHRLNDGTMSSRLAISSTTAVAKLYVGTNENGAGTNAAAKYRGYIDDIAIFNRSLTENELSDFVMLSSTSRGPSGCRWQADEAWDFDSVSTASVSVSDEDNSLSLTVIDRDWGYGRVRAHLSPRLNLLTQSNVACLDVDVPQDTVFEFGLSSGNGYCLWFLNYANRIPCGPDKFTNGYLIDLTRPMYCQSPECAFRVDDVQEAWIASDWASKESLDEEHPLALKIRGLTFGWSREKTIDSSSYGGAIGPIGSPGLPNWCWQPQATDPGTQALWSQPTLLSVQLIARAYTTSRLVADFGDSWVNLSQCKTVSLDVKIIQDPGPGWCTPRFLLLDMHGAQNQWSLEKRSNDDEKYEINIAGEQMTPLVWSSDMKEGDCKIQNVPVFDISLVKMLGIQSEYNSDCNLRITINDVRFLGADGKENCAIWTCH